MKLLLKASQDRYDCRLVYQILLVLLGVLILVGLFRCSTIRADYDDMRCLGFIGEKHSHEIDASPWGLQYGSDDESALDYAAELGVKWTRLEASWAEIEHAYGEYDWSLTDKAFAGALNRGITPFITINGSHQLYCRPYTSKDAGLAEIYGSRPGPPTNTPEAMHAWLAFVRALVERYNKLIKYWEIWNEPNHFAYWGAEPDAIEYGRMVREAATLIKQIDPQAVVIAGSTAGLDPKFVDGFLQMGAAHLIDKITFHNYSPLPEERIYKAVEVRKVIDRYNPSISLWQGECGSPSHSSTRDYRGISPWGLNIQAKWLLRQAFTDVYFCGAQVSVYFKLVDTGRRGVRPQRSFLTSIDSVLGFPQRNGFRVKSVGVNEKCLLNNPDLTPKPAYYAYQNLCALMDGRYKAFKTDFNIDIKDVGVFYGIGREDDAFPSIPLMASFRSEGGAALLAYWLPWHPQEIIRPAKVDIRIANFAFQEPVLVDLLTGKVYQLADFDIKDQYVIFKNIPLSDYPLTIAERKEIRIIPIRKFK